MYILVMIFPGALNRDTPLWFWHSLLSPFLEMGTITNVLQLFGVFFYIQTYQYFTALSNIALPALPI
jgi:hypothetical protein